MAKVRVQMDITKERPQHVWLGFDEEDLSIGKWQLIQYEDIPDYYECCRYQGHIMAKCIIKRRDDETKRKKE